MQLSAATRPDDPQARLAAVLGAASFVLLFASLRWAHHWSPVSIAIVAAWAFATAGAVTLSLRSFARGDRIGRAWKLGFALTSVSVAALVVTGVAWAFGADPAGACGGG
jgi:hypothetical protein